MNRARMSESPSPLALSHVVSWVKIAARSVPQMHGTYSELKGGEGAMALMHLTGGSEFMRELARAVGISLSPIPVIGSVARGDQRLNCSMRGSMECCVLWNQLPELVKD